MATTSFRRLAFAVIVVGLARSLAAQQDPHDLRAWMAAVRDHLPGRSDEPVARIATWSERELLAVVRRLPSITDRQTPPLIKRALVLHTDIIVERHRAMGYDLPPAASARPVIGDGQGVGQSFGTYHWEVGRQLAAALVAGDAARRDNLDAARLWYRTGAAVLQLWGEYPELNTQLDRGAGLLGVDPILLLYAGTKHQEYAGPGVQLYMERQRGTSATAGARTNTIVLARPKPESGMPGSVSEEWSMAEEALRAALARDPGLAEARIRLGHVLGDRGQHADAVVELRRAAAEPLDAFLDYYASLLLGREEQALGHAELAWAAYGRAASRYPTAQSPRLALSQMALARGDHADAHVPLLEVLRPRADGGNDPWWQIRRTHDPSADTRLAEMRRRFSE